MTLSRWKTCGVVLAPLVTLFSTQLATRPSKPWRTIALDHLLTSRAQAGVAVTTIETEARADIGLTKLSSEIRIADTPWSALVFKLATSLVAIVIVAGSLCLFSTLVALQLPAFCTETLVREVVFVQWH